MGVYIPNIRLPGKCSKCRDTGLKFSIDALGLKCPERKELWGPTEAEIKGIRRPDCPLVYVQEPHGRLGDLNALGFAVMDCENEDQALCAIDEAPTIIPAEEKHT